MYFEHPGRENTEKTIEMALDRANSDHISYIVIASNTGETVKKVKDFPGHIICVTHVNGFKENGTNEMEEEVRHQLIQNGVKVLTTTHVLSGAERSFSRKFGGVYPVEIMAQTLRMFGQGVKVSVETAVMALDAGLIPHGRKVIAIGGSGRGADTALIITPSHASDILSTKIHEIICKPKL